MSLFAHVETGLCVDVQPGADEAEYRKRFAGVDQKAWQVERVPDTTEPFAIWNGTGVDPTNPPKPPAPTPPPGILSATAFQDVCETGLGGGTTGATRFGAITRAMDVSADDLVFSLNKRFVKSITFDKTKSAGLFNVLVAKGLMTAGERTAILAAWV